MGGGGVAVEVRLYQASPEEILRKRRWVSEKSRKKLQNRKSMVGGFIVGPAYWTNSSYLP